MAAEYWAEAAHSVRSVGPRGWADAMGASGALDAEASAEVSQVKVISVEDELVAQVHLALALAEEVAT